MDIEYETALAGYELFKDEPPCNEVYPIVLECAE